MKIALLVLLPFQISVGVAFGQTPLPPYLLPSLPSGASQRMLISGTVACVEKSAPTDCQQFAGSNWLLASEGGSGGDHWTHQGVLLIGTPATSLGNGYLVGKNSFSFYPLTGIQALATDGTASELIRFSQPVTVCSQTSTTSLQWYTEYVMPSFSVNVAVPDLLYLVTVSSGADYNWSSPTTGSCVNGAAVINGPYTEVPMSTYSVVLISGLGV